MIRTNSEIRNAACVAMRGHWGKAALLTFLYLLITVLVSCIPYVGEVLSLLLLPLSWGFSIIFLQNNREDKDAFEISRMFAGYSDFGRIFCTMFLTNLYTVLWTLLLIVPGIIKSLSYAMTGYILADNPEMKNNEAIEYSMTLMDGHKKKLFLMQLLFLLYVILGILTLFIGYLWLLPYMQASYAKFYEEVKEDYSRKHSM